MPFKNIGAFIAENNTLIREWAETRLELYKLKLIRIIALSVGQLLWSIISLFLFFLMLVFAGIMAGFWFSGLTGSYTTGFGLSALAILGLIVIIAVFRKKLFLDPLVRKMIRKISDESPVKNTADEEV
jgi:hypothetical protein